MLKNKNSFTHKLPQIRPLDKNQSSKIVKSKLENHMAIKPSSGYERRIDYRFETDEEIEMEKHSQSFVCKENQQKKKNSFFSSSQPETIVIEKTENKSKKLGFFYCDSLAIRPQGKRSQANNNLQNNSQINLNITELPPKIDLDLTNPSEITSINTINYEAQSLNRSYEATVEKSKYKRMGSIFKSKNKPSDYKQNMSLPSALQPMKPQKKKIRDQEFHIIFEADEITECCF